MPEHYYTQDPESPHRIASVKTAFKGRELSFETDAGVFSRDGLDKGTSILLEALPPLSGTVLDLGCGWGPVGISLKMAYPNAEVTLVDINSRAVDLAKRNAEKNGVGVRVIQSDGFSALSGEVFSTIVTNPPIRAGKQVIYGLFADSLKHLEPNGALYLVIRKQQGAPSAVTYLENLYKAVDVVEKSGGFWVVRAVKP